MPKIDFSAWLTSPEPILKIVQKKLDAKKKRGDGKSVKKEETPGIMKKKKKERRREGGPEKKILDRRALRPNQEAQEV